MVPHTLQHIMNCSVELLLLLLLLQLAPMLLLLLLLLQLLLVLLLLMLPPTPPPPPLTHSLDEIIDVDIVRHKSSSIIFDATFISAARSLVGRDYGCVYVHFHVYTIIFNGCSVAVRFATKKRKTKNEKRKRKRMSKKIQHIYKVKEKASASGRTNEWGKINIINFVCEESGFIVCRFRYII